MEDQAFQALLDSAVTELDRKNRQLRDSHGLGSMRRWSFDPALQQVQFHDQADRVAVEADAVVIGSFVPDTRSWRWGWADESLSPALRRRAEPLRALAVSTGFRVFAQEGAFEIDGEDMAWEFAALAVRHLGAPGSHRIRSGDGPRYTYLALMAVARAQA